jgi:hypothetical protein
MTNKGIKGAMMDKRSAASAAGDSIYDAGP